MNNMVFVLSGQVSDEVSRMFNDNPKLARVKYRDFVRRETP